MDKTIRMKTIIQISILIAGIAVAIICIKTTIANGKFSIQKEHFSHINMATDTINIKTLPHYNFKK